MNGESQSSITLQNMQFFSLFLLRVEDRIQMQLMRGTLDWYLTRGGGEESLRPWAWFGVTVTGWLSQCDSFISTPWPWTPSPVHRCCFDSCASTSIAYHNHLLFSFSFFFFFLLPFCLMTADIFIPAHCNPLSIPKHVGQMVSVQRQRVKSFFLLNCSKWLDCNHAPKPPIISMFLFNFKYTHY